MKIRYLGTAAAEGWPAVFCQCDYCRRARKLGGKNIRTRSQVLIDDHCLVDFPPDTYFHAIRGGLDLGEVEELLITHSHEDHLYLDDLAMRIPPYAYPQTKLELWGNQTVVGMVEKKILGNKENSIKTNSVQPGDTFQAGSLSITALAANHMKNEEALLFIIEDGKRGIFHAHDSGWYPDETWERLAGKKLDLVNFDCTAGPNSSGGGHMGIPEILKAREKLWKLEAIRPDAKCVITHFSHNGGLLHEELKAHVAGLDLIVAYDEMVIEI